MKRRSWTSRLEEIGARRLWGRASSCFIGCGHLTSATLVALFLICGATAKAQYTGDCQTNAISGVNSNWVSDYLVGSNYVHDALVIHNGGALFSDIGYIGYAVEASNNIGVVSDSGSVWSNQFDLFVGNEGAGNQLIITNGGVVCNGSGYLGFESSSSDNTALVGGSGSVWSNQFDLFVGNHSTGNRLIIASGATVYNGYGYVGYLGSSSSNNAVLVSDAGSVWNNQFDLFVGNEGAGNQLIITNGGAVYSRYGYAGNAGSSSNNMVLVSGSGSAWSNQFDLFVGNEGAGNQLIITNGGVVDNGYGYVGNLAASSNNTVLVSGTGSVWNSQFDLYFGNTGEGNQLTIEDGATVYNGSGYVGNLDSSSNNTVLVSGTGSLWNNQFDLYIGYVGAGNQLTIVDKGLVIASNAYIGWTYANGGNQITVSGGALFVTNGLGSGVLDVRAGALGLNSGTVTVDDLIATNGTSCVIAFNGGVLNTKATTVNNGSVFTVGNSMTPATLNLDSGGSGFHSFADGMAVSSNATLKGNGTVIGAVTVDGGGVLSPGSADPGSITFSNNLSLSPNSAFVVKLNGNTVGQYDQILVLGTANVSNSVLILSLGYTPSLGDSFTIISNLGPDAVFGTFVDPQGDVLTNNATFLADGTTFQIDYHANAGGQDVVLTVVVPEPSTWLLVMLGVGSIAGQRRRLHLRRVE